MGFTAAIKALFGTPKVVDTVADTVKSGVNMLDNAFFTDQEKAENGLKIIQLWLEIQKTTANENSIRSITRRVISFAVVFAVLVAFFIGVFCACFDEMTIVDNLIKVVDAFKIGWAFVGVITFYVGFHMLTRNTEAKTKTE